MTSWRSSDTSHEKSDLEAERNIPVSLNKEVIQKNGKSKEKLSLGFLFLNMLDLLFEQKDIKEEI